MKGDESYFDPRVARAYDREAPGLPGDVEFYKALALEAAAAGHDVLELAVGTGRVAIPIARAGVRVVGLDVSPAMLEVARQKAEGITNLELVEADMADFELGRKFGLIYVPYRSFLHLTTVEQQKSCLGAVRRHLVPGGRFALNFFNPDIVMMGSWLGPDRPGLRLDSEWEAADGGRGLRWETRRYVTATQEIDQTFIHEALDSRGEIISRLNRKMRLRYVFRYEMQHLLELCGFEVEALYGGFRREPFTDSSSEMVWVARRPA
ncbi:MAG TPA: class I SAM-dependent methyltransferase [Dehalococcoidia bacterium]|nr:class I SAM-dependent methyltransferase [Dehalococcoidia bacterium]